MSANGTESGSRSGLVLLIENEDDIRKGLGWRFVSEGLEAVCVATCAEALRELKKQQFAVAVLDLGMSPIDGKTCGGYIHTLYPRLPLVAYTGYPEVAEEAAIMREHGFVRRFIKPDDEGLIDGLRRIVRGDV
jgi:DNA-binding NtrC family response regulator